MQTYVLHYYRKEWRGHDEYVGHSETVDKVKVFEAEDDTAAIVKASEIWQQIVKDSDEPHFESLEKRLDWQP